MNAKQLIAAAALTFAGSAAFAADFQVGGDAYVSFPVPSMTNSVTKSAAVQAAPAQLASAGKTRAEVTSELAQARGAGQPVGGEAYVNFPQAKPARVSLEVMQTASGK